MKAVRIVATVAVVLVATVSQVEATCGWVLWEEVHFVFPKSSISWIPLDASENLVTCERAKNAWWQLRAEPNGPGPRPSGITDTTSPPGRVIAEFKDTSGVPMGHTVHKLHCLPDTVDPRK